MVLYIGFILKFNEPFIFKIFSSHLECVKRKMLICGRSLKNLLIGIFDNFMLTDIHTMYSTSFTKLEESNKTIQRSVISKCWRKLGIHGNRFDSTITIV